MRIGVAQAREQLKELLDRVRAGETVEITRRGEVVAVLAHPGTGRAAGQPFEAALHSWRTAWQVDQWPEEDPFDDVRSREPGREAPW